MLCLQLGCFEWLAAGFKTIKHWCWRGMVFSIDIWYYTVSNQVNWLSFCPAPSVMPQTDWSPSLPQRQNSKPDFPACISSLIKYAIGPGSASQCYVCAECEVQCHQSWRPDANSQFSSWCHVLYYIVSILCASSESWNEQSWKTSVPHSPRDWTVSTRRFAPSVKSGGVIGGCHRTKMLFQARGGARQQGSK